MTRRKPAKVAAATAVLTLVTGGAALAAWQQPGTGAGASGTATLASPGKPLGTPTSMTVALSWTGSVTPTGGAASYLIERAPFGGTTWTPVCTASHNPGTATSCADTTPSAGDYQYRVLSALGTSWRTASPVSDKITTFAVATATPSVPNLLTADDLGVSNSDDITSSAVTRFSGTAAANAFVRLYRAGVEVGSQQMSGTSWTISPATLAEGDGLMTATAQVAGQAMSAPTTALTVMIDRTAPTVTGLRLTADGSGNGSAEKGDTFSVTYASDIAPSTICPAWSTSSAPVRSGNNNVTVSFVGNGASADTVQVTMGTAGPGCSVFRLGSLAVQNYNGTNTTLPFGANGGGNDSTVSFAPATSTLTVQLGTGNSAGSNVLATPPTLSPVTGITDLAGNPLATTAVSGTSSRF